MVRAGAVAALVLSFGVLSGGRLHAHPLHSSYAELTREPTGAVVMHVRLFAEDFGALIDSLRASSRSKPLESVAREYVQSRLTIANQESNALPTEWCGMRSAQNVVWVCIRTAKPISGSFRVRNALMFDRFADQISIIRWTGRKETRTLVLSARVPEALLN
jgi:hypothetical protein